MSLARQSGIFFGWRVVGTAFALAVLGWGTGFYGPPIYLQGVKETKGWPVPLISTAVTMHFVVGAVVVANLPTFYMRFGVPVATKAGAISLAVGILGWSSATAPWQLFVATLLGGRAVVALTVAVAQAAYAFAPAAFGLVREFTAPAVGTASATAPGLFFAAAFAQGLAIYTFLLGRNRIRALSKSA